MWRREKERQRESVCTVTRAVNFPAFAVSEAYTAPLKCCHWKERKKHICFCPLQICQWKLAGRLGGASGAGLSSWQVCYRKAPGWSLVGNNVQMKGPSAMNLEVKSL